MTYRSRWALGLVLASAFAGACSSKSNPPVTGDDGSSVTDAGSGPMEAAVCAAVPLSGPVDGGLPACFACIAMSCMAQLTACSTDCMCAPAYQCLGQKSIPPNLNTGYSSCDTAVGAIADGNQALTMLNGCAQAMCNSQCFGGGGSTSGD
jgi:hypothetical protein